MTRDVGDGVPVRVCAAREPDQTLRHRIVTSRYLIRNMAGVCLLSIARSGRPGGLISASDCHVTRFSKSRFRPGRQSPLPSTVGETLLVAVHWPDELQPR